MNKEKEHKGLFEQVAENVVLYKLKTGWLQIAKFYDKIAAKHDATISMAFVLIALDDKEGTPVTKIAPRIGMEPNSLSRVLKKLIEDGYVLKTNDKTDKRKVLLVLTKKGRENRKIAMKAVFNLESSITEGVSSEELLGFFKVVRNIPKAINRFNKKGGF